MLGVVSEEQNGTKRGNWEGGGDGRENGDWEGGGARNRDRDQDGGKKRKVWREPEMEVVGTGGEEQETREEYELEQGEGDEVDVGNRDRGAGGGDEDEEEVIGVEEAEKVAETVEGSVRKQPSPGKRKRNDALTPDEEPVISKDERKRLKKERRKME